ARRGPRGAVCGVLRAAVRTHGAGGRVEHGERLPGTMGRVAVDRVFDSGDPDDARFLAAPRSTSHSHPAGHVSEACLARRGRVVAGAGWTCALDGRRTGVVSVVAFPRRSLSFAQREWAGMGI